MVALQETRCSGNIAVNTIKKLGFKFYLVSEARGFSGGIWLMWNRTDINVHLIKTDFHFLHVQVSEQSMDPWLLTVVYASPRDHERNETWQKLHQMATTIQEPWIMMGDFNEIANPDEKKGGAPVDIRKCHNFNDWINDCRLMDVNTAGTKFTWRGPRWNGRDRVFKRLDRILCNVNWRLRFHEGVAKVLPRVQSDHHPIIVQTEGEPVSSRNQERRKPHLIGWDICCLSKNDGGLGFKSPRLMNEAFLMKILWNLINKPDDLWCQVLYSKYGRNKDLRYEISSQPYDSPLWKALSSIWEQFQNHIVWQLGDGNSINFWMDKWTPNGSPLMINATNNIIDTTLLVKDVLTTEGHWDLNFLHTHLNPNIVSQIMAIPAPIGTDGDDTIGWKGTNTHHFTIKSAYDLQHGNDNHINGDWNKIWAWKGPHRIQTFMWIAAHGRLLTNARRSKWGVGVSPICSICGNDDETVIHTLRDCMFATRIWIKLVSSNQITNFFSSFDCREWIFMNLNKRDIGSQEGSWQSIFMVACWHLWNWRNKAIFEEDFQRPNDPSQVILRMTKDIEQYERTLMTGIRIQRETIYIGWKNPHGDWIKLNCDGAYKDSMNNAGCGGLFRDSDGRWLKGYTQRIGDCDALHAEMWGMYTGMEMARRQGYTHLVVESDSKLLIDMVTGRCKLNGKAPILVNRIQDLSNLQWHVMFKHTWREGNRCADWLASFSLNQSSYDVRILEDPPRELQQILFDDVSGACMPRSFPKLLPISIYLCFKM
ncbi:unnamed protein product [Trifolium pratense]|uniref:Uncharacterized protein n=1 Tax=Trifolium pratense TaxID=57577 RepID=A0ACB0IEB1_TRIPR|nr:unnamed protein product [Trifolium pratense]